jgi:hypothetical protein
MVGSEKEGLGVFLESAGIVWLSSMEEGESEPNMPHVFLPTTPVEIQESLARFKSDFPDEKRVAFVMMKFGSTDLHNKIVSGIRSCLNPYGIEGVRADDKSYHDDIFWNIMTYIYGATFGIAVFERIESNEFNPNVSLEVGYMMGIGKSVCLLKDKTLSALHTDLVGKLYLPFDPHHPAQSIEKVLPKWLKDKNLR